MSLQPSASVAADDRETARPLGDRFDLLTLALLVAHGLYWTLMPALTSGTFPLDTGEALFWGREWQLGYYKHPPLSAWIIEAAVAAFGRSLYVVYLVPQLCVLAAFAAVWWLGRRLMSSAGAFLSILALEIVWPFTFESPTYNANIALLPFWAWTIAFAWAALEDDSARSWARLGLVAGLGLLAKYSILLLIASIGFYCLVTRSRRWVFASTGPWVALGAAFLVVTPHLYWLLSNSAGPVAHALSPKLVGGVRASQLVSFVGHQLLVLLPLLAVGAVWANATGRAGRVLKPDFDEGRKFREEAFRFLLSATLCPSLFTIGTALLLDRKIVTAWSYPFLIYIGLVAVLAWPWLAADVSAGRLPRSAAWTFGTLAIALLAWWPIHLYSWAAFGSSAPRIAYDGPAHGALVDALWATWRADRLRYQVSHFGGSDSRALGSTVAFFSRHRPSVFHGADTRHSPWIDPADYRRHGGIIVSETAIPAGVPFAGLCVGEVRRLERPVLYRGYRPAFFYVGYLAPSPEPRPSCP